MQCLKCEENDKGIIQINEGVKKISKKKRKFIKHNEGIKTLIARSEERKKERKKERSMNEIRKERKNE